MLRNDDKFVFNVLWDDVLVNCIEPFWR